MNKTQGTADKVAAQIEQILLPVEAICRGQKPDTFPPQLFELMNRMWQDAFLAESPASYVVLPGEDAENAELMRNKGETWVHPISQELTQRRHIIDSATHKDHVFNYKILGLDPHFRRLSRVSSFDAMDPIEQCEDAAALILTRSDMHGLRQALHIMYAKLTLDGRARNATLIIQNTHKGFWDPLFDYLGIQPGDPLLADMGIHVTHYPGGNETADESVASTLHVLKNLPNKDIQPRPDRMDATIKPGDTVYVASGSAHKAKEISQAFSTLRARVNVYSLNSVLDVKPQEAEEASRSLEGNNMEKLASVMERIRNDIGYDNTVRALCPHGARPENTWLMFDDRGLEFMDPRILETRAFDPVRSLLNPYPLKPGPGAELAWILKTISRTRLFETMLADAAYEIDAKGGAPIDTTVVDTACHITVRLDWLQDQDKPRHFATMSKVRAQARTYPMPVMDANKKPIKAFQTDHYLVPMAFDRDLPHDQQRTKAEIPNYIEAHSEVAGSVRTLGDLTGIAEHSKNLSAFNLEFRAAGGGGKQYRIASLHTLFPDIHGHGTRKIGRVVTEPFSMMSGSNSRFSMAEFRRSAPMNSNVRTNNTHRDRAGRILNRLRALYQEADGFILTEDNSRLANFSGLKWLKTLLYFSLIVGKQVDDRDIKAKFYGHLDRDNASWAEQERIFDHLAQTPLLMNRHDDVLNVYSSGAALRKGLRKFNTSYIRPRHNEKGTYDKDDRIPAPSDLYRVTVYCSASLGKETAACRDARLFAYNLANGGFALINGGGKEGLMFATSEGVHDARRDWRQKSAGAEMPRNHVTSFQCHDTFEREGGWHKDNDDARIFEVIEERMANLMNTDAEILMAGGAGSIQEIAASLMMRQWGVVPVSNRPLIIVNEEIDGVRVFDALLDMMTNDEMVKLNVHVVESQDRAMDILLQSRTAMAASMKPGEIYIPDGLRGPQPHHSSKPVSRMA